jgi:hypothetical protein
MVIEFRFRPKAVFLVWCFLRQLSMHWTRPDVMPEARLG